MLGILSLCCMSSVSRKLEAIAAAERGDTATAAVPPAVPAAEETLSNDVLASRRRKPAPISYWTTGPKDAPGKARVLRNVFVSIDGLRMYY
jgi:hypothetical protein